MGGRGSSYTSSAQVTPNAPPAVQAQPSTPSGLTLSDVQAMDDQQLHDFLIDVNKTDIPAFLNDIHLQRMIYALGMNDTPEIVDSATFKQLTTGPGALTPIYRTVNDTTVNGVSMTAQDICDMLTDGDTTYVGNGIHGDGLYFSNDLAGSKAYGHGGSRSKTVAAVLNMNAKVISETQLKSLYDSFVKTHPQSRKALGFARSKSSHDSMSQFALTQGYNVITSKQFGGEVYYTVLDRSVLTMTRDHY